MKCINTGKTVTLKELILGDDISDNTIIQVWQGGQLVARGSWFQDNVLQWTDSIGRAYKTGTGRTVDFHMEVAE